MKRLFASRRRVLAHIRVNAIAYFALFFALGGTSVAATDRLVPSNSVGSAQVINGSLQKTDLASTAVNALKGNRGLQGPAGAAGSIGPVGPTGQQGPKGDAGAPGASGTPGTNGTIGTNGVSVTSAAEPVGANCANGGSKFTAASANVTYACNGQDGISSGPLGQAASTVFSSGSLSSPAAFTLVPNLSQTIVVPAGRVAIISTDGGLQSSGGAATADVVVFVDGVQQTPSRRMFIGSVDPNDYGSWSMSAVLTLAPGVPHTIQVRASQISGAGTIAIGGGPGSPLQGQLSIVLLRT
jgi:Collagen triple helix repeat (20 copies)